MRSILARFASLAVMLLAAAALVATSGCASSGKRDPNYSDSLTAYLRAQDNQRLERETLRQNLTNLAAQCPKPAGSAQDAVVAAIASMCVTSISRDLAALGGAHSAASVDRGPPAYTPPPSGWQVAGGFLRDVSTAVVPIAGLWSADRANERSADRELGIVQAVGQLGAAGFGSLERLGTAGFDSLEGLGTAGFDAFTSLPPTTYVNASGPGSGIGNTYTDASTSAGNDVIGRDRVDNSGIIGDDNCNGAPGATGGNGGDGGAGGPGGPGGSPACPGG